MGPGARSGSSGPAAAAAPRAAYYSESVPASGGPAAEPSSDSEAQAEPSGLFARKSDSEALTYRSLRPGCHTDSDVSVARARAGRRCCGLSRVEGAQALALAIFADQRTRKP